MLPSLRPSLLALALVSVWASTCASQPQTRRASQPARPAPVLQVLGDAMTGYAEVMRAQTIDGTPVGEDRRATALVVFASWCGPCRQELADLGALRKKYPALRVIGLNAYEEYNEFSDELRLRKYIADNAPWLTQIVHADAAMLTSFGKVPKIPTLFVYDEAGTVVAEFRRDKRPPPSHEELETAIARAVEPTHD